MRALKGAAVGAEAIHGDKSQQERDWVLGQFRAGALPVMVATDVAGRSLDVKDVTAVVNYDAPSCAEDYVHRVGRAGAGASGVAVTSRPRRRARRTRARCDAPEEPRRRADRAPAGRRRRPRRRGAAEVAVTT